MAFITYSYYFFRLEAPLLTGSGVDRPPSYSAAYLVYKLCAQAGNLEKPETRFWKKIDISSPCLTCRLKNLMLVRIALLTVPI